MNWESWHWMRSVPVWDMERRKVGAVIRSVRGWGMDPHLFSGTPVWHASRRIWQPFLGHHCLCPCSLKTVTVYRRIWLNQTWKIPPRAILETCNKMFLLWLIDLLLPFCTYLPLHPASPAWEQEHPTVRTCHTLTLGCAHCSLCAAQPLGCPCPLTCCSPLLHELGGKLLQGTRDASVL